MPSGRAAGPRLRARLSSWDHPCGGDAAALLARHPLVNSLELLVPLGTLDAATALQPRRTPFYQSASLALPQLADPAFVAAYLLRGAGGGTGGAGDDECVCALTAATPLDRADAAALTPDGTLHLSLSAASYSRLGVAGRACAPARGGRLASTPPRYAAALRLAGPSFAPGRRHYERVTQCLRDCAAPLRFLLSRTVAGCSADVAFPPSAQALRHPLRPASRRLTRLTLPPLAAAFGGDAQAAAAAAGDAQLLAALHDWLGAVAAGVAGEAAADAAPWRHTPAADDVAEEEAQEAAAGGWPLGEPWAGQRNGWAEAHRWRGLLAPAHVASAVAAARGLVAAGGAPWAALTLWGFADSPVAWLGDGGEAAPRGAGANDACLLLLPKDRWLLLTIDTQQEAL